METGGSALRVVELAVKRMHDTLDGMLDEASGEFDSCVDPAVCYEPSPTESDLVVASMCYFEWLVFERPMREGKTPLQVLADDPPEDFPAQMVGVLRQVAQTQFFSRFAIEKKDLPTCMAKLVDVRSGQGYEVLARHLCEVDRWKEGTIGMRIACVDGLWQDTGKVSLYDRCPPRPVDENSAGEIHPGDIELPEAAQRSYYLRLVRDLIGVDGRFRSSARYVGGPV